MTKTTYFLIENGRLGNQLFQFSFVRGLSSNSLILALGFSSLDSIISDDNFLCLRSKNLLLSFLFRIFYRLRKYLFKILSRSRLFSVITDSTDINSTHIVRKGLFPNIFIVYGFFQDAKYMQSLNQLSFNKSFDQIREQQYSFMSSKTTVDSENWFFCHIRRGDYLYWPNAEKPAVLPLSWYLDSILNIKYLNKNAHFFIFSDDYYYLLDCFSHYEDVSIMDGDLISNFAAMTLCKAGGILSPSTFAWWAAKINRFNHPDSLCIAPLFWNHWRSHDWRDSLKIQSPWITYTQIT